jgi:dTDP-4-dehydrorhamnose 3,5-epimerase
VAVEAVPLAVEGCLELRLEPSSDRRGSFLKWFHQSSFAALGVDLEVRELFVSRSATGVVRGLHFQRPPADVAKLVCCLEGAVVDAVIDLRVGSPTFGHHCSLELSDERGNAVYVPPGCAHGFYVTRGEAVVLYAQSGEHDAVLEGGILWSSAGIEWPAGGAIVSDRDAGFPTLASFESPFRVGGV